MPTSFRFYRIRIRTADDTADALVLSTYRFEDNPYGTQPPEGDGESFDPISGAPTTGSYSVRVADPETATNVRPITAALADVYARQQLIARKAWIEESETGDEDDWAALVVGYITGIRLVSAIEYAIAVGQSRRIEVSRVVFKEATEIFDGVTCVIGGPVIGGFINDDFLEDHGGWQFEVDENTAVHVKLALTTGFDPRKYAGTFGSTSTAIADYTNDWARNFFEPTDAYGTGGAGDIKGYFPGLRARLLPVGGVDPDDVITLIPLARPATGGSGPWWNPGVGNQDKLTGFGTSQLYLPKEDINGDPFSPSVGTDYYVWVYAVAISKDNPLHWFGHPVDLWEQLRIDAGIPYDASVLPALKARLGLNLRLALRIMSSSKLSDFDQKVIYGPFRLSSRIEDGERILISVSVWDNDPPTETITILDLRSDEGTVFDLDESTVVTDVTLKSQRIIQWTSEDADQPEIDSLISRDAYPQTIQNSADDIPGSDTEKEEVIGDIPGMIWKEGIGPVSIEPFLIQLGAEMFDRFGRGGIMCELKCRPSVTSKVGEEVLLDLPHLPGAVVGESPVSQRNIGPLPFQVIQRTEMVEGSDLKLVNSISPELAGEAEPLAPEFTLAPSVLDNERYALDTITNADDLNAANLDVAVYYALSPTEPDSGSGTHFMTVPAEFMTNPTFEFDLGPYDNTEILWVQMRAEKAGLRPGPFTAWQSVAAATYLTIAGDPMTIDGELAVL